jgi:hypothetical protein
MPTKTFDRPHLKCKAHSSRTGEPCKNWALTGAVVCTKHGAASPAVRRKAAERIAATADKAVIEIIRIMYDKAAPYATRLSAAMTLLDRSGLSGRADITLIASGAAPWEVVLSQAVVVVPGDLGTDTAPPAPPSIEYGEVVEAELVEEADVPATPRPPVNVTRIEASLDDTPPARLDPDGYHKQGRRRVGRITR